MSENIKPSAREEAYHQLRFMAHVIRHAGYDENLDNDDFLSMSIILEEIGRKFYPEAVKDGTE